MKFKKVTLWVAFFATICFFLAAFRPYSMGTDTLQYAWMFKNANFSTISDYGFILLIKGLRQFTSNPRILFVFCSFLITFLFARSVILYSPIPLFSYLLFIFLFYFASLNIMRQFASVAIFYGLALPQVKQKNLSKYLFYCFLAFTIHFSSLILFITYFLENIKIRRKVYFAAWIISLVFLVLPNQGILEIIMSKIAILSSNEEIVFYKNNLDTLFDLEKTNYYLYLLNFIYILCLYLYNNIDNDNLIFFKIFTLNIIILNIFNAVKIATRFDFITGISLIYILAEVTKKYNMRYEVIIIIFAMLKFYYDYFIKGVGEVFV